MKKYFVCSDVHGFFTPMVKALEEKGFDKENKDHILILVGDMLDRGHEAREMVDFCLELLEQHRLLFVKGNHETLFFDFISELDKDGGTINSMGGYIPPHHISNRTCDTVTQLTGKSYYDFIMGDYDYDKDILQNEYVIKFKKLVDSSFDYFETPRYIFTHGWIPNKNNKEVAYRSANIYHTYNPDWREATKEEWESARWDNGMDCWHDGVVETNKIIVCGHWHCSYGNFKFHSQGGGEFEDNSVFTPFVDSHYFPIYLP